MVEIPMYYAREFTVLFKILRLIAVPFGYQPIASGCLQYVSRVGSIPRNTAVGTHLLQREPFAIISQYHRKGRRSALQILHLHNDRYLCHTLQKRFFDFAAAFTHLSPQFVRNDIGEICSVTISAG